MIQNYFLTAARHLKRRAFFSTINIAGLAVALAACWLIGLYVFHEHSYDKHLPHAERICAVALDLKMQQEEGLTTNTPPPLGPRMLADFPEIACMARTFYLQETTVRLEKPGTAALATTENSVYAADTAFLELFDFPMVEGSVHTALDRPGSLVLSEWAAMKFFGKNACLGQSLFINDRLFTVSGVVKDQPQNTTVQFDFLVPMADFKVVDRFSWSWVWLQVDTWVRLREPAAPDKVAMLEAKFPAMVRAHAPDAFKRIGQNFEEQLQRGDRYNVMLLPLQSLHLGQKGLVSRLQTLGDGAQVRMFGIVGLLTLLLACINYMNLSTARATLRAREVGVRKTLGSQRRALVAQFMTESVLSSALSMVIAAVLAALVLPLFNRLTSMELSLPELFSAKNLLLVMALAILAALMGGLYPAFMLSKFRPIVALKGSTAFATNSMGRSGNLRSSLVVFQFSISIALLLFAWVVFRQVDFARTNSPGMNRENVLVLPVLSNLRRFDDMQNHLEDFRQKIENIPEVQSVSYSVFLPGFGSFGDVYEPEQGADGSVTVSNLPIASFMADTRLLPTLGLQMLEGRNFQDDLRSNDSTAVILNEAAVKVIGWKNPIGQWLRYPGNQNQRFQVVGIVRDFHLGSVRGPIEPVAFFHHSSKTYRTWANYVSARLKPGMEKTAFEKAGKIWAESMPWAPFSYRFLDETYNQFYRSEARMGTVLGLFTGLALFIGCFGLFALAAFSAEQRTKEIGIRKVLGASARGIATLLANDFLKLILLATLLASPVAYYFMQKWLSDFAYRIDIQWWMFVVAGMAAIGIASLTIVFQTVRAALVNPVKSLRNE